MKPFDDWWPKLRSFRDDPDVRWPLWLRKFIGRHLGYRGVVLLMFGLIYLGVAFSIPGAGDYRAELVHTQLPTWFRVLLWAVPGALAFIVSWDGKYQGWGFAGLFISPANRAVSFGAAFVMNPSSAWDKDSWSPLPGLLVYFLMAITMLILSGWPEPADGERVEHEVRQALLHQLGPDLVEPASSEDAAALEARYHNAGEDEAGTAGGKA